MLAALAAPLFAQTPVAKPSDLFVTRLQGASTIGTTAAMQSTAIEAVELPPFPVTALDDRLGAANLDGQRRVSLTVSRPMPLRDLLLLLVNGTPLSLVYDDAVDGAFLGELKDLTMRQALEAVLFPRSLDYDVVGTLVRVFPRKASTRLLDVNYLNVRRRLGREVRNAASIDSRRSSASELSTSSEGDRFDELGKGVEGLLSASGRMHIDRAAGLMQVTDFVDRLDLVRVYVEAVQMRAMRQVRINAHVFDVALPDGVAMVDWKAVAVRAGARTRGAAGHGASGMIVTDIESLKKAIAEQGVVTLIAAPHLVTMNNEPAVIHAGTQAVYFETGSTGGEGTRQERTANPHTVLEGLTLSVTAQVSADGLVMLAVAPAYSTRAGQTKSAAGESFPVLRISEADTMVRVQDGETIVLSGFLENRQVEKAATGFAAMFGTSPRTTVKSELVILLTPTIVSPGIAETAAAR
jgi:type II secretory pathway component GspD/PulD (secretin)